MHFKQVQRFILAKKIFWGYGQFKYKVMFFVTSNLIFHLLVGTVQELADHLLVAETGVPIMECFNTLLHTRVP